MKTNWEINITGNLGERIQYVVKQADVLGEAFSQTEKRITDAFTRPLDALKNFGDTAFKIRNGLNAVNDLTTALWGTVDPVVEFDRKARELQSITQVTEPVLKQIKGFAKESAAAFGGSAADYLETYKILLSKLGPELAEKPDLLAAMGRNVAILSKSMNNDALGAVEVLTTAMNQYGVSIEDPLAATEAMSEMMNAMQAGAIAGSSELTELQAGIAASGAMARAAGLTFTELNAALQVLDKGSKKGAEGGIALRNILARMGEGRFMPEKTQKALSEAQVDIRKLGDSTLSFTERLRELSKIKADKELISQFFGVENVAAGQFMLNNIHLLEEFTQKIEENKTAAIDSANIVMASHEEKMNRMFAFFNNLKISFGELLGSATPYVKELMDVTGGLLQTMPGILALVQLLGTLRVSTLAAAAGTQVLAVGTRMLTAVTWLQSAATGALTVAQNLLNVSFWVSPVGLIVAGVAGLVGALVVAYNKVGWFRDAVNRLWEVVKRVFEGILEVYRRTLGPVLDALMDAVEWVLGIEKGGKKTAQGVARRAAEGKKEEKTGGGLSYLYAGMGEVAQLELPLPGKTERKSGGGMGGGAESGDRTRLTHVTIHIHKLNEKIEVYAGNLRESAARVEEELVRVLTAATNELNQIARAGA